MSTAARLIVCERSGRWAAGLRRELTEAGVRVWETRSLADCWEMLAQAPASFVVVELTLANLAGVLHRMAWQERDFPLARIAVAADRSLAGCQRVVEEAGAVHFCYSPATLGPLARLACCHLAMVPAPQHSLTERIWAGLPWGKG